MNYEKKRLIKIGQWKPSHVKNTHSIQLKCYSCCNDVSDDMRVIYGELAWKSYGKLYICDSCNGKQGFNER